MFVEEQQKSLSKFWRDQKGQNTIKLVSDFEIYKIRFSLF
jgi:hypothetical protein